MGSPNSIQNAQEMLQMGNSFAESSGLSSFLHRKAAKSFPQMTQVTQVTRVSQATVVVVVVLVVVVDCGSGAM